MPGRRSPGTAVGMLGLYCAGRRPGRWSRTYLTEIS